MSKKIKESVNIGSKVWFRGKVAKTFSARGVVERVDNNFGYGVRLENGNFQWANNDQVKTR
jgi:hypothetical protein